MSKYIVSKLHSDRDLVLLTNRIFDLYIVIGRYVTYCNQSDIKDFRKFCSIEEAKYAGTIDWSSYKTGYRYLRDKVFPASNTRHYVSGIRLRRLARKHYLGVIWMPTDAPYILDVILHYVISEIAIGNVGNQYICSLLHGCDRCKLLNDDDPHPENGCAYFTLGYQMDYLYERGHKEFIKKVLHIYHNNDVPALCKLHKKYHS